MNNKLQEFARNYLKDGLYECTDKQRNFFKLIYGMKDLDKDINDIVDIIPEDRLNQAMDLVERTLEKNNG